MMKIAQIVTTARKGMKDGVFGTFYAIGALVTSDAQNSIPKRKMMSGFLPGKGMIETGADLVKFAKALRITIGGEAVVNDKPVVYLPDTIYFALVTGMAALKAAEGDIEAAKQTLIARKMTEEKADTVLCVLTGSQLNTTMRPLNNWASGRPVARRGILEETIAKCWDAVPTTVVDDEEMNISFDFSGVEEAAVA